MPGSSVPEGAGGTPTDTTLATTTTQAVPIGEGGVGITVTASTKVWAIIAALVTVAFLIASLTAVYWRHTRPTPSRIVSVGEDDIAPPEAPLDAPGRGRPHRRRPLGLRLTGGALRSDPFGQRVRCRHG